MKKKWSFKKSRDKIDKLFRFKIIILKVWLDIKFHVTIYLITR